MTRSERPLWKAILKFATVPASLQERCAVSASAVAGDSMICSTRNLWCTLFELSLENWVNIQKENIPMSSCKISCGFLDRVLFLFLFLFLFPFSLLLLLQDAPSRGVEMKRNEASLQLWST